MAKFDFDFELRHSKPHHRLAPTGRIRSPLTWGTDRNRTGHKNGQEGNVILPGSSHANNISISYKLYHAQLAELQLEPF